MQCASSMANKQIPEAFKLLQNLERSMKMVDQQTGRYITEFYKGLR